MQQFSGDIKRWINRVYAFITVNQNSVILRSFLKPIEVEFKDIINSNVRKGNWGTALMKYRKNHISFLLGMKGRNEVIELAKESNPQREIIQDQDVSRYYKNKKQSEQKTAVRADTAVRRGERRDLEVFSRSQSKLGNNKALVLENKDRNMINKELTNKLEKQIPALMQNENLPGLSLTLLRNAEIFWNASFGVRSNVSGKLVTKNTVFEAASLSKPVFAYEALKLCETGILDLDMPLTDYLPDPYIPDEPRLKLITLRHVLSHATGFPNWRPKGKELKMYFSPGERFSYSGEGYMYLQAVVAHIMEQEPAELLHSNLLIPLGMKNSCFVLHEQHDLPIAVGHNEKGTPKDKYLWKEMYAAASLHCTSQDYGKFMCAVLQPSPDNPAHLSPEMTKEMLTPQVQVNDSAPYDEDWPKPDIQTNNRVSWGLGWGIQHTSAGDSVWHWGDNGNYRAFALGYPSDGQGIVIMTNGKNGQNVISRILRDLVGGEYPGLDWLSG